MIKIKKPLKGTVNITAVINKVSTLLELESVEWEGKGLQNHFYLKFKKNISMEIVTPQRIEKDRYLFGTVRSTVDILFTTLIEGAPETYSLDRGSCSVETLLPADNATLPAELKIDGQVAAYGLVLTLLGTLTFAN
ncbi:hypothetical protein [Pseudomonas salomonii]|uniref:Immunity protein 50 n=1 Tax=Pseudomonas salomonii TaxID=191391 RepID=A0ABS9GGR5_9PSED|nr:hypothetical protein [Pseudomonas salomonii]MCF5544959.1 hypothetical protein [Pseudomonas salomonii]